MSCVIDGCSKPTYARRLCHPHWSRRRDGWPRLDQAPIHGTRKRYEKGCRCDDCSRRESEYRAAWRLATGRTTTSTVLGGQP